MKTREPVYTHLLKALSDRNWGIETSQDMLLFDINRTDTGANELCEGDRAAKGKSKNRSLT